MACVAGFIAGSSLPLQAQDRRGVSRLIHERGGRIAIGFVVLATTFSLSAQAIVLGGETAAVAARLGTSPGVLLVVLLPHALIELTALFLPLAAWIIASRRGDWDQLLAATVVTVAIALPMLVVAAVIEVYVSPHVMRALVGWDRHCSRASGQGRRLRAGARCPCAGSARRLALRRTTFCIVMGDTAMNEPKEQSMAGTLVEVTDTNFQAEVLERRRRSSSTSGRRGAARAASSRPRSRRSRRSAPSCAWSS